MMSIATIKSTRQQIREADLLSPVPDSGWCSLPEICRLLDITTDDKSSDIQFQRRRVKAGQWVFGCGERFDAMFIVFSGFLKTLQVDEVGNEQILGFPMKGDLLGIDGLHDGHYASQAVALTDCELIVIPIREMAGLGVENNLLENWLYRAMSRELVRGHAVVGLLGTLGAEARVARFLVSLSARFAAIGYSPNSFNLRMTRQEIGSYLGLTLETVSRSFSALNDAGLININQRAVEIKDITTLRSLQRLAATPKTVAKVCKTKRIELARTTTDSLKHSMWAELTLAAA